MFPTLLSSAIIQIEKDAVTQSIARHEARLTKRATRAADAGRREREPRHWFRAVHRA
jgi:hypothetical protein